MWHLYMYVVVRDFGFAPNPFHGRCTLTTCKPSIRRQAQPGDWVVGMGGTRLKAVGRCIFAMQVDAVTTFDEYWRTPRFFDKRPVRNGSLKMLVGDNIYRRDEVLDAWVQADSHHSNPDGSQNPDNVRRDTCVDRVLLSTRFHYFGSSAPLVPSRVLSHLGYRNSRGHRTIEASRAGPLMSWLADTFGPPDGLVHADPIDFMDSARRYSPARDGIVG